MRPNNINVLNIILHDKPIGTLVRLGDDKNILAFNEIYINDTDRPTLSLSFKDISGGLITS